MPRVGSIHGRRREIREAGDDEGVALEFEVEWVFVAADLAAPGNKDMVLCRDGEQARGSSKANNADVAFAERDYGDAGMPKKGAEDGFEFDGCEGIGGGFAEILGKDLAAPT